MGRASPTPATSANVYISHLAQDLEPSISRADFFRLAFSARQKTSFSFLSITICAFVKSHPCRIIQAFPVTKVNQGYEKASKANMSVDWIYDNGVRLDLHKVDGTPSLDMYIKVDALHSEPIEYRFDCHFRLAVDSGFYRFSHPALWSLPTQYRGSLYLKPVRSPMSSAPSTPPGEPRRLFRESRRIRQPSSDNTRILEVAEDEDIDPPETTPPLTNSAESSERSSEDGGSVSASPYLGYSVPPPVPTK